MHVDLLTLYYLVVGTLLASAGLTLWEAFTHPARRRSLKLLALGYTALATGCLLAIVRAHLPDSLGAPLSNLVILAGYLLVWHGLASLAQRRRLAFPIALWLAELLAWLVVGGRWQLAMWMYFSAAPIALVCALAARDVLKIDQAVGWHPRHIVAAALGVHALTYALRILLLPWLVARYGDGLMSAASSLTMYEGVLFSVLLPMAVLRLVREETHGELLQESRTDYLTRLGNRRWFFGEAERLLRAQPAQVEVVLMAFDLDHFKRINDQYGHPMGDQVLRGFAVIARQVLGARTLLARIGGEEFVALLPGHDLDRAAALGELLVRRFAEMAAAGIEGIAVPATVSVGLACQGPGAAGLAELLAGADRALYRAKSLGGNRLERA